MNQICQQIMKLFTFQTHYIFTCGQSGNKFATKQRRILFKGFSAIISVLIVDVNSSLTVFFSFFYVKR